VNRGVHVAESFTQSCPNGTKSGADAMNYLKKLYDDCNEVVKGIKDAKLPIGGAINWADLRCVSAERVVEYCGDLDTFESYRVCISEVSPDAAEFQKQVALKLVEKGHAGVQVATEW
jgi:hypothetical protein